MLARPLWRGGGGAALTLADRLAEHGEGQLVRAEERVQLALELLYIGSHGGSKDFSYDEFVDLVSTVHDKELLSKETPSSSYSSSIGNI